MTDEQEQGQREPTREERIELVVTEIIKRGGPARVHQSLLQKYPWADEEIEDLIDAAWLRMVSGAPVEIRASSTTIVGYHRWNNIYERATNDDTRIMAQKQIDRLMGSIH